MTRTTTLIASLIRLCRDPGSKVGVIQKVAADLDRILTELKLNSDDLAVVEALGGFTLSGIRVSLTSPVTVSSGGALNVAWDQTDFNQGGWTLGAFGVVTPPVGVTRVVAIGGAKWAANAAGDREACVTRNTNIISATRYRAPASGVAATTVSTGITAIVNPQFFQFRVDQDSGGDLDLLVEATYLSVFALDA